MKRRSFVKTSIAGGVAAALPAAATASASKESAGQYYELRIYTLKNADQQKLVENYYQGAAIPALNAMGIKNVGVFTEMKPEGQTKLYVLIPYSDLAQVVRVSDAIDTNAEWKAKGAAYLNAAATAPAYERIESSLMKAFKHSPQLAVPGSGQRIFELRQYQSPTEAAGKKKVEMFNDQGEIDIFKRLGFKPVFWGETIVGPQRPNLTYMVTFDDMAAKDAHWKAFGGDPQWKKISAVPEYADALLINKITSTMLVPAGFSQI